MELGQKNLCPVCSPLQRKDRPEANDLVVSDEELEKITLFLIRHPDTWNAEFDSFYDELKPGRGYRDFFAACRQYMEILSAIREILSGKKVLTGELIIQVMDEIPQHYPGINEDQARQLARMVFSEAQDIKTPSGKQDTNNNPNIEKNPISRLGSTPSWSSLPSWIQKIPLPRLGKSEETVTIRSWKVKEGDTIKKGDVLFDVETDKSVLDVESQFEGTVLKILVPAGKEVPVLTIGLLIGPPGAEISEVDLEAAGLIEERQNLLSGVEPIKRERAKQNLLSRLESIRLEMFYSLLKICALDAGTITVDADIDDNMRLQVLFPKNTDKIKVVKFINRSFSFAFPPDMHELSDVSAQISNSIQSEYRNEELETVSDLKKYLYSHSYLDNAALFQN